MRAETLPLVPGAGPRQAGRAGRLGRLGESRLGMVSSTAPKAFPTLCTGHLCKGCGNRFAPTRRNQRHCRPSCRVLAHERRQAQQREAALWEPDPGRPD